MSLTDPERQRLEEIERTLTTESPKLAEIFVPGRLQERSRIREQWRRCGLAMALFGMVLDIFGASLGLVGLTIAAAAMITLSSVVVVAGPRMHERRAHRPEEDPARSPV